ncbi:DUF1552 domain-containing protein [Cyclobacterium sp.]|uniref:DUF1552 domain-containing protein n=1 Tax=Cyclobacterium sp. TaxID=1966343 RepID=UPI00199C3228|nr:DUF1552 domain-containing protein [Cyclobacterium sp.]MBD3628609.1 DUF1552 domain-containing protein [Cyclobacterium sp.]
MSKKWQISRRKMLKGVGAAIALPFMEAMASPLSLNTYRNDGFPVRSAFMFMPNGVHPGRWTPEGIGNNFQLSPTLSPLNHLKDDILVLGQLMNKNAIFQGADGHYAKTANLLTCMPIQKTAGDNINSGGISVDQLIANHYKNETLFPSLEYGLDRIKTGVDINVGFTRLYASSISWKNATTPLSKEIDPRLAFDRLFKSFVPGNNTKENPHKSSILDAVMTDAKSLKNNLGRSDQDKLEEYLESIRSIEKRINNQSNIKDFAGNITPDIKKELVRVNQNIDEYVEVYAGVDVTEKTRLMFDIMALALWSDASRVATFMFGNSVSNRNFSFLEGVNGAHHSISHHMNHPEKMEQYDRITKWHLEQYAYFLNKLKSIKEGNGTLLDNSLVMFASGLRDGNRHSPRDLPIIVGGRGGGKIKSGQNLIFEENTPLANLYTTWMQATGIEMEHFADSSGILHPIIS